MKEFGSHLSYPKTEKAFREARQKAKNMTEVERLQKRLIDMKVTRFHVTRGEKPSTPEEIAAEVNRCLDKMEAGELEPLELLDSDMPSKNIKDF